ncbi:glutamate--cysteine ligase [Buchnera aphidicola (Hyadaphis tataricae)]|uniref:Glutamate--cysteine ligase n=1 Tax=Buchnera aphidicola (Hyadaphis tataricae) TaxID=1241859 RepID=A0A4D6XW37_9GAMM|nr:glutamate--cysteine ligase [Buchnera aphidicola]QCI21696.1 glutamate--cysteine ligase [Buchnera aphidicola (Hyadaphis tataricae)]
MIPDISEKLSCLKKNPKILKGIFRGIEREALRTQKNGIFSENKHPYNIGSALTHRWITTDFAENLLEFITPTSNSIDYLLSFLKNLHSFVASKTPHERIWPFSIPYSYNADTNIKIAQYGLSKIGKIKTTYRIGLKKRYGDLENTISGVHYNFSLPITFWKCWNEKKYVTSISSGYFNLIRNYYQFGWIIPYLFGASPAISKHLFRDKHQIYNFKKPKENILYLPWSTSLRLSNIECIHKKIIDLNIMFNDLNSYVRSLNNAITTPSKKFVNIGLKDANGNLQQLNTNFLQMESELYTQIRPKIRTYNNESFTEALQKRGVEYVEIRSLDINPFSSIGINKTQILFLDLFLIWCALIDSPPMNKNKFLLIIQNWKKIIFEGRKPNQKIYITNPSKANTLEEIVKIIFNDLKKIAWILDDNEKNFLYQKTCEKMILFFKNPELTYSAKCLKLFLEDGAMNTALYLSNQYHKNFIETCSHNIHKNMLEQEVINSHKKQKEIEGQE